MKGDFKTLLRKFCLESSVMGLKYFYLYPDPLSRCFWAVSIVFTLCMAFTLSLLLHNRFAALPTRIVIENQCAPLENVSYPAITICSPNQVTLKAVIDLERTLVDGNRSSIDLKSFLPQLLGFYMIFRDYNKQALNDFETLIWANRYSAQDIMYLLPQKCDDFLKLCYLKGQLYPNCKGLFNPILTKHGMCCIFNSIYEYDSKRGNKRLKDFVPHTADTGGIGQALTVVTDYDPDSALSGALISAGAVRTSFTDPYEFPADDETNLVQAHTESFHSIHATYTYCSEDVTALAYWSRQCYFSDEHQLKHFTGYRNSDCDLLCVVQGIEKRCGCSELYVPHVWRARACNITSIDCIVKAKRQMNQWYDSASCDCLRDCVSTRYYVEVSVGNLMALPHIIHEPYPGIQFNMSTSIQHFFFPSSVHVKQKQETVMSLITLSSNLGGVFGLCLGCSMISVLEIFFYIYCAIRNRIQQLREYKNNRFPLYYNELQKKR